MAEYGTIAVIYGSDSSEWEVSCRSGEYTASRIDITKYDVYEVLLSYWNETMGDDVSMISVDEKGYALARETENIMGVYTSGKKKGQPKVTGWDGKLIPKGISIDYFFADERDAIAAAEDVVAQTEAMLAEMIEDADEDSIITDVMDEGKLKQSDVEDKLHEYRSNISTPAIEALKEMEKKWLKISKKADYTAYIEKHPLCQAAANANGNVSYSSIVRAIADLKAKEPYPEAYAEDAAVLEGVLALMTKVSEYNRLVKQLKKALDEKCRKQYAKITDEEIIELLVNRKWCRSIYDGIDGLYTSISHYLAARIITLVDRYEETLPDISENVDSLEGKVKGHLERMGFAW